MRSEQWKQARVGQGGNQAVRVGLMYSNLSLVSATTPTNMAAQTTPMTLSSFGEQVQQVDDCMQSWTHANGDPGDLATGRSASRLCSDVYAPEPTAEATINGHRYLVVDGWSYSAKS